MSNYPRGNQVHPSQGSVRVERRGSPATHTTGSEESLGLSGSQSHSLLSGNFVSLRLGELLESYQRLGGPSQLQDPPSPALDLARRQDSSTCFVEGPLARRQETGPGLPVPVQLPARSQESLGYAYPSAYPARYQDSLSHFGPYDSAKESNYFEEGAMEIDLHPFPMPSSSFGEAEGMEFEEFAFAPKHDQNIAKMSAAHLVPSPSDVPNTKQENLLTKQVEPRNENDSASLHVHRRRRTKSDQILCRVCNKTFPSQHEARRHQARAHPEERFIIVDCTEDKVLSGCNRCDNGYKYMAHYNAAAHLWRRHVEPKQQKLLQRYLTPPDGTGIWKKEEFAKYTEDFVKVVERSAGGVLALDESQQVYRGQHRPSRFSDAKFGYRSSDSKSIERHEPPVPYSSFPSTADPETTGFTAITEDHRPDFTSYDYISPEKKFVLSTLKDASGRSSPSLQTDIRVESNFGDSMLSSKAKMVQNPYNLLKWHLYANDCIAALKSLRDIRFSGSGSSQYQSLPFEAVLMLNHQISNLYLWRENLGHDHTPLYFPEKWRAEIPNEMAELVSSVFVGIDRALKKALSKLNSMRKLPFSDASKPEEKQDSEKRSSKALGVQSKRHNKLSSSYDNVDSESDTDDGYRAELENKKGSSPTTEERIFQIRKTAEKVEGFVESLMELIPEITRIVAKNKELEASESATVE